MKCLPSVHCSIIQNDLLWLCLLELIPHVVDEFEGALLDGWWKRKAFFIEFAHGPGLKILLPLWEVFQIIIHPLMLKEKCLIAPQGSCHLTDQDNSANQVASRAAELVHRVSVSKHLPEDSSRVKFHELVREVFLPRFRPGVYVVRLELEDERPARITLLCAILRVPAPVLNTHRTDEVGRLGQLLSNRVARAIICGLSQMC